MFLINQLLKTVSHFIFQGNFANPSGLSAPCPFHNFPPIPLLLSTWNSSLLQPIRSPLKNLAKKQKREQIQYRKWNMGAAKMRLSILCVRDDFSIFYIVFVLFSSVLIKPFSGRLFACGKLEFKMVTLFPVFSTA